MIELLDCTLRDGGYINDWDFGHNCIISILKRLIASKVDIIEIGFIDERRSYDENRTIFPSVNAINNLLSGVPHSNVKIVGMIDYGTVDINNIPPRQSVEIDGIRVIFKEAFLEEALIYCEKIKNLGYDVFAQMVSVTTYSDEKLKLFAEIANRIEPYAVSMVDTYGLMHQNDMMHIFEILDTYLISSIRIGFHSHNNFQMAYSNSIEFIEKETDRVKIVDSTLYGMGKSAGNAPIELLGMYLNEKKEKHFDLSQFLEAIELNILPIYDKAQWGYNLLYYVAASGGCHPSYVSYLMGKKTISIQSVTKILSRIPKENKLIFDKDLIAKLYFEYQNIESHYLTKKNLIKEQIQDKTILILGPGESILNECEKINTFINKQNPIVISLNYIPKEFIIHYVFLSNYRRYLLIEELLLQKKDFKVIATSNINDALEGFDYIVSYKELVDERATVPDNSFLMILRLMIQMNIRQVFVAGFDGYKPNERNYYHADMEDETINQKSEYLNKQVQKFIKRNSNKISINFLTSSLYQ